MEATVRRKLLAIVAFAGAATLSAQTPAAARRQARQAQLPDSARPNLNNRANLEQLVRERMAQVTKQRLGATDDQMVKLQATNRKFDEMRRTLVEQERDVR